MLAVLEPALRGEAHAWSVVVPLSPAPVTVPRTVSSAASACAVRGTGSRARARRRRCSHGQCPRGRRSPHWPSRPHRETTSAARPGLCSSPCRSPLNPSRPPMQPCGLHGHGEGTGDEANLLATETLDVDAWLTRLESLTRSAIALLRCLAPGHAQLSSLAEASGSGPRSASALLRCLAPGHAQLNEEEPPTPWSDTRRRALSALVCAAVPRLFPGCREVTLDARGSGWARGRGLAAAGVGPRWVGGSLGSPQSGRCRVAPSRGSGAPWPAWPSLCAASSSSSTLRHGAMRATGHASSQAPGSNRPSSAALERPSGYSQPPVSRSGSAADTSGRE